MRVNNKAKKSSADLPWPSRKSAMLNGASLHVSDVLDRQFGTTTTPSTDQIDSVFPVFAFRHKKVVTCTKNHHTPGRFTATIWVVFRCSHRQFECLNGLMTTTSSCHWTCWHTWCWLPLWGRNWTRWRPQLEPTKQQHIHEKTKTTSKKWHRCICPAHVTLRHQQCGLGIFFRKF